MVPKYSQYPYKCPDCHLLKILPQFCANKHFTSDATITQSANLTKLAREGGGGGATTKRAQTRGGAEDSWNFRIWIIQQKVTSHPVSSEPRSSFHKAKKWRFDLPRFSSICNPSGSVPIKLRVGSCCRHIPSTLKLKLLAKDNISLLFWRKITESLLSSNGGFYTFAKLMLFRLLVLVVRDWVITLSEIAHDVRNDLDEVLLAMVCTVYNGNIDNRSRFSLKVGVSELCIHVRVVEKTSWIVYSRSVSYFRISCWILFSL